MTRRNILTDCPNIENTANGRGRRLVGWTPGGRHFRLSNPRHRSPAERWLARAVTPRDGEVNEVRGATLADISLKLASLP